jgi:cytochrome b
VRHDDSGRPSRSTNEAEVPYALVLVALIAFVVGMLRLRPRESRSTPWGALLVWAMLFAISVSVWLSFARLH